MSCFASCTGAHTVYEKDHIAHQGGAGASATTREGGQHNNTADAEQKTAADMPAPVVRVAAPAPTPGDLPAAGDAPGAPGKLPRPADAPEEPATLAGLMAANSPAALAPAAHMGGAGAGGAARAGGAAAAANDANSEDDLGRFRAMAEYILRVPARHYVLTGTTRDYEKGTHGTAAQKDFAQRFFRWLAQAHPDITVEVLTAHDEARREAINFLTNPAIRAAMPTFRLDPEVVRAILQFGGSSGFGYIPKTEHHPEYFRCFAFGYMKKFDRTPQQEAQLAEFLAELAKRPGLECLVNNSIGNAFEGNVTGPDGKTTIRTDSRATRRLGPCAWSAKPNDLVAALNRLLAPHTNVVLTLINRVFCPSVTEEDYATLDEATIAKRIKKERILLDASHGNEAVKMLGVPVAEFSSGQCTLHLPDGSRTDIPGLSGDGLLAFFPPSESA